MLTQCSLKRSNMLQGVLKEVYSGSEVVLVAELIKLIFSGYLVVTDNQTTGKPSHPLINHADQAVDSNRTGFSRLGWLLIHAHKVLVLVILYGVANILSYYALARVDAALYTVLLQLKILTTAGFSVILLGRVFSGAKWRALILLIFGCILVASPVFDNEPDESREVGLLEIAGGIGSVLVMVSISGYTGVYFEMMLKKEKISVWERNFQLAFYSVIFMIIIITSEMTYNSSESAMSDVSGKSAMTAAFKMPVFFKGWTINAFLLAAIQAGGGLLVAATLKYADSILKTLATSGAIVLSALLGHMLLGADLDVFVGIGCCCTILAICNYSLDASD